MSYGGVFKVKMIWFRQNMLYVCAYFGDSCEIFIGEHPKQDINSGDDETPVWYLRIGLFDNIKNHIMRNFLRRIKENFKDSPTSKG